MTTWTRLGVSPDRGAPRAPGRGDAAAWSVRTLREDDALTALAADWEDLYARCSAATPFQSWHWLESWWRSYGQPGRLRLVLVHRHGRLVAAAALTLQRRGGFAVLRPLGEGVSDFTDVLADDEHAAAAVPMLAIALLAERGWQVLDLGEARPAAVAGRLARTWPGPAWTLAGSVCLELPGEPIEAMAGRLPRKTGQTLRRKLRKIESSGLSVRGVDADRTEAAVADLLALHELQWRGRDINPEHLRGRYQAHLTRALSGLASRGEAVVLEYRDGGELLAADALVVGRDMVGHYLSGVHPELRERVDVTALMMRAALDHTVRLDRPTLNLLRGEEPHKFRLRPRRVVNRRLVLARPGSLPGAAYGASVRGWAAAVAVAKERVPWLRAVRRRVRAVEARRETGRNGEVRP